MDVELNAFVTIFISEVASTLKIDFKILYQFNGSSQTSLDDLLICARVFPIEYQQLKLLQTSDE
ncbi:hypothetical protein T06_15252 [Trichinella sp. T6]|nr:hypothetical protein T06_15252 [Trichinella sp. T6]